MIKIDPAFPSKVKLQKDAKPKYVTASLREWLCVRVCCTIR